MLSTAKEFLVPGELSPAFIALLRTFAGDIDNATSFFNDTKLIGNGSLFHKLMSDFFPLYYVLCSSKNSGCFAIC